LPLRYLKDFLEDLLSFISSPSYCQNSGENTKPVSFLSLDYRQFRASPFLVRF
jgi:hypothetical protein